MQTSAYGASRYQSFKRLHLCTIESYLAVGIHSEWGFCTQERSCTPLSCFNVIQIRDSHVCPSSQAKKILRQRRKREQLIDDSSDDDDDGGGFTLSSDDANNVSGNSDDDVLLKVKLVTEHVSGDGREKTDVTAQIVSETSYEDWEVDIENKDYGDLRCKLSKNK